MIFPHWCVCHYWIRLHTHMHACKNSFYKTWRLSCQHANHSGACCRSLLLFSFPLSNIKPEKVFCMQVKLLRNRAVKWREAERGQKRKQTMHLMHNIYNNPEHGRIMWSSTTMMKSQGEAVWDGSERRWGWESVCDLGVWHQTRWQYRKTISHETNKPSEIEPPPPLFILPLLLLWSLEGPMHRPNKVRPSEGKTRCVCGAFFPPNTQHTSPLSYKTSTSSAKAQWPRLGSHSCACVRVCVHMCVLPLSLLGRALADWVVWMTGGSTVTWNSLLSCRPQ